ncbi:MAG: pyridoxal-phosphate-dependent aminotransferase family protein, partial [Gemmatimonadota bacterium]
MPGPVGVRPEVLAAMTRPMIAHRTAAYEALHATVAAGLQGGFGTTRPVWLLTMSATGAMEMALRGLAPGRIVSLVNGEFADRFAQVAEGCGHTVQRCFAPVGGVVPLAELEAALVTGDVRAVTVVHVETSTGAASDLAAVAALARHYGALTLVDAVTSVGAQPVLADAWDLDFVFTGSQKALALPPGLAFAVASERYLAAARANPRRGLYLDPLRAHRYALASQSPTT